MMDETRSKSLEGLRRNFGSQYLNVVPGKDLERDDQQLSNSIGLRFVAHTFHCGENVERDGLHSPSRCRS